VVHKLKELTFVYFVALTTVVSSVFASSEPQLCAVSTCLLMSGILMERATTKFKEKMDL
jgi:hypothetical protein